MIRILVLGMGHLSNGEITIAIETLRCLQSDRDFEILFVSHKSAVEYIRRMGMNGVTLSHSTQSENLLAFSKLLKDWQPSLLLCADVYTMEYAATWSGVDFAFLKSTGLQVGSFDQYEWDSTNFEWDYMGIAPMRLDKDLIENCDFLIRPCPLNKTKAVRENIIPAKLFSNYQVDHMMDRDEICKKLNLSVGRKIIFLVNSNWEYIHVWKTKSYYHTCKWLPRMIYEYLDSANTPIEIVHVGPKKWNFHINKDTSYHHFDKLEPSLYKNLTHNADLFCTTNAISITLSSAIVSKTPSLLFYNAKKIEFDRLTSIFHKMPSWYREMAEDVQVAYPFSIFPWGWNKFLAPVFLDNPYNESFDSAPVYEPKKCINKIRRYLLDPTAVEKLSNRQKTYFESLETLAPLNESLKKL